MHSTAKPNSMTVSECAREAAGIMAKGIMLAKHEQINRSEHFSESGLDSSADSSVHRTEPSARGENR